MLRSGGRAEPLDDQQMAAATTLQPPTNTCTADAAPSHNQTARHCPRIMQQQCEEHQRIGNSLRLQTAYEPFASQVAAVCDSTSSRAAVSTLT